MKKQTVYVCEHCGREYHSEEKARQCEEQHFIPCTIKEFRFYSTETKVPSVVVLADKDGNEYVYLPGRPGFK